ncbi:MAG: S-layer homology domain-containing protein [Ruminiclostridium sp.]|nr:S-layer homology domain-containing protein [Ruminiclostridium sp.]
MDRKTFLLVANKITSLITVITLLAVSLPFSAYAADAPETVFSGDIGAGAILNNIDYSDVKGTDVWSKPAIYEAGALEVIKGFGNMNRRFGRTDTLAREEALSVVYRAAGREAEAQIAGEALNNARTDKKTDALQVWYDGFLQLAANDGLITQQQLADALNADQSSLDGEAFKRKGAVQRQEMAYWMAKALNLQAIRGQQDILNNYLDWRSSDPEKVPFIEAVLQNRIMNGDGSGRFNPAKPVTREQAAQIVKNAEAQVLAALKYDKMTGVVEEISSTGDYSTGTGLTGKNIDVRSSAGTIHRISTQSFETGKNEQKGNTVSETRELVVYKNGNIGDSSLLENGDRIEYITRTSDKAVKYINVLSNINEERYVAAQISSVDPANRLIKVMQFFRMDFLDPALLNRNVSFNLGNESQKYTYRYSSNIYVTVNGSRGDIDSLSPDATVILTIDAGNTVTAIQSADFGINSEESTIVKGIVEDNNPELGYITLYNEDGTGAGMNSVMQLAALRTYNYINRNDLEVFRNHSTADIDDIQTGDTAFLKLDDVGNIISISAVDNYMVKYGRIISKLPGEIAVEYKDGMQQILTVGRDVLFIRNKKLTAFDSLRDGDRVKLLLNITNKATDLKEVTIEGDEHFISNIYKGEVSYMNEMSDKLILLNMQVFRDGAWERTGRKGFTSMPLSDEYRIYLGDSIYDIEKVNRLLAGNEAYIAVEKDYGGEEKAVLVSYRFADDTEVRYTDNITVAISGSASFGLSYEDRSIGYDAGSIVVKNGRLVSGGSLSENDRAYVVANRSYGTGYFNAGVVLVEAAVDNGLTQIFRARIKAIDENNSFTVESFSQLIGTDWEYCNTPKTFSLTFDTRLLGDDGVLNMRDFKGYGDDSYLNRSVYVVSDGTDALLVSTASYGTANVKGTVFEISGGETGEEGAILAEPDYLRLRDTGIYNVQDFMWDAAKEMSIDIPDNTIIIKDGKIIKPSEIENGDDVRIIKKDTGLTGDAYIILVEN